MLLSGQAAVAQDDTDWSELQVAESTVHPAATTEKKPEQPVREPGNAPRKKTWFGMGYERRLNMSGSARMGRGKAGRGR
ncbi:hypothetical protein [Thiolapillus sp.]